MTIATNYLRDAADDLKAAKINIRADSSRRELIVAAGFASVGAEKLLKGLLAKVNPGFVLAKMDFDIVAGALHLDQVTDDDRRKKLAEHKAAEVVTLRLSIQRAGLFYPEVKQSSHVLHALSAIRDTIFHRCTSELEDSELERVVKRDLYVTLRQLTGLAQEVTDVWEGDIERLECLSQEVAAAIASVEAIEQKLAVARARWQEISESPDLVEQARQKTASAHAQHPQTTSCACPACENEAVVYLDIDFDYEWDPVENTAMAVPVGVYPDGFKCFYCELVLSNYDEFNHVDLDERLEQSY